MPFSTETKQSLHELHERLGFGTCRYCDQEGYNEHGACCGNEKRPDFGPEGPCRSWRSYANDTQDQRTG